MILQKLIMKNFRQFRGVQQIEFASGIGTVGNVTVIYGENGRGKTGIFRAVMFCLYGEHKLSQDEEVEREELYLINSAELQESASIGKQVETYVELLFKHKGESYSIKRYLLGMLDEEKRIEQLDKVLLSHTKVDGNTDNFSDPDQIRKIINNILDKNVREYFLFDGEKIQRLTLASLEQRREISKGIRNLLNIDALEKAIKATARTKKNLSEELGKKATGELGKIIKQCNDLEEKRDELTNRIKDLEGEYSHADNQKKQTDKKLDEYNEIRHLLNERLRLEEELKQQEEQARNLLSDMKIKTAKASILLVSNAIDFVYDKIEQKKKKGEIPSEIRKDLIEKILTEKRCICSREIIPGTEPFKEIIIWKNKTCDMESESSLINIWRDLSTIRYHREDTAQSVETLLQKYALCKNEIEKLRSKIDGVNKEIGSSERKDAADLEKFREKLEEKQIKIEAERTKLMDDLKTVENEHELLSAQKTQLSKQEKFKDELTRRVAIAEDVYKALETIHKEFTNEIKNKIIENANKYFKQLLDKEGQKTLDQILINDDYSLQILDKWGKPFLANISAGQRQIMSISFISALAKVASADKILEMPLFMDTPFGRLSSEHRRNLIEKIPEFCAQWILLATDTEFRKQEATMLMKGGCWGKFYTLKGKDIGTTEIQERNISDAQSILHDTMEK